MNMIEKIISAIVFDKITLEEGSYYVMGITLESGRQYNQNIPCDIVKNPPPYLQDAIYMAVADYHELMEKLK